MYLHYPETGYVMIALAIATGLLALFAVKELVVARQYVANRKLRVLLGVVLFAILHGVLLLGSLDVAFCGGNGCSGWTGFGMVMLSFIAVPTGMVVSLIAFFFWSRPKFTQTSQVKNVGYSGFIATIITALLVVFLAMSKFGLLEW